MSPTDRPLQPRSALTRDAVVTAAIEFVDDRGLARLSMRNLGAVLSVQGMALYRHVNGREDLLEAMVDRLVGGLRLGSETPTELVGDGWQGYLQWLAHEVRRIAVEHPRVFPLIASRHPSAPWLRPPLRSLEVVEDFMTTLCARGFSDEHAVAAYQAFSSFLLGNLLLESAVRGAEAGPVEEPLDEGGASVPNADGTDPVGTLEGHPLLRRVRPLLSQDRSLQEFEDGLEALLNRLDVLVTT